MRKEGQGLRAAYSFWLLPSREDTAGLEAEIAALAPNFGTPPFTPHATVHGDLALAPEIPTEFLHELAEGIGPLVLRVVAVETSPERFRSLFLRLEASEGFALLQERSRRLCGSATGLSPFPHLSLAYGEPLYGRGKGKEAGRISALYAKRSLTFDRLALAASSSILPIDDWRIMETVEL